VRRTAPEGSWLATVELVIEPRRDGEAVVGAVRPIVDQRGEARRE
jgi:hypothetical protein